MRHRKVKSPHHSWRQSIVLWLSPAPTFTWNYFTMKCSKRANLTLDRNEGNYGKLLSLSTANICRKKKLVAYNLFSTLAKPVLFHLSWETPGAWIIHEDSPCLSYILACRRWVCTLKCNEVKLEIQQTGLQLGGWNIMCLSLFRTISVSLKEQHQGNGLCIAHSGLARYSQNSCTHSHWTCPDLAEDRQWDREAQCVDCHFQMNRLQNTSWQRNKITALDQMFSLSTDERVL